MRRKLAAPAAILILAAILFGSAHAAGVLTIDWYSVDGGGAWSGDGAYALNGSVGQPDAGNSSSASFSLNGGFWFVTPGRSTIYLPITAR